MRNYLSNALNLTEFRTGVRIRGTFFPLYVIHNTVMSKEWDVVESQIHIEPVFIAVE